MTTLTATPRSPCTSDSGEPPAPVPVPDGTAALPGGEQRSHRRVRGTGWAFLVGLLLSAAVSVYTVRAGTNLDYGDAMAHLTISRRILDSKAPGLAQLGSVWLPVPHLLLMPLVQNMWLFRTGVAGCILGALCLGVSTAALWRIVTRLELRTAARVTGIALFLVNPSLLYVSTTALTEPVLIATILCTMAGLIGWSTSRRQLSGGELAVFAGLPAAAGVLTRYEAWPVALAGMVYVAVVARRRGRSWGRASTWALSFAAPSAVAAAWWLAYNTAVFGNPLEFLTGEYSAAAFTDLFEREGELTTKGNFGLSSTVYGYALLETAGIALLVLAALGLLTMTWRWTLDDRAMLVWIGGATSVFLVFSLTTGQHIMVNDASLPAGAYNNRYVLSALPWLALLAAVGITHVVDGVGGLTAPARQDVARTATTVIMVAAAALGTAGQLAWWAGDPGTRMTVIEEADKQHVAYVETKAAATWMREHYDGGGILMDQTPDKSSVAPILGIPLDEFFTRSVGPLFDEAIADPYDHARWVFMHRTQVTARATETGRDMVTEELADDAQFLSRYRLVYAVADIGIYRRAD